MSVLEPTFHGYILSNEDALCVIEAAVARKLPLIQRRPLDRERPELIRLGNVFVFIEETSDIKRWTDGISWSASRILGRFLIYRKLDRNALLSKDDKKKAAKNGKRSYTKDAPIGGDTVYSSLSGPSDLYSHYDNIDPHHSENADSYSNFAGSGTSSLMPGTPIPVAQDRGLMKKTLTLTIPAHESDSKTTKTIHLISYFSAYDVLAGNLIRPFQTEIKNCIISPLLWLAMRRSSLGGKLLSESEANFYLDSKYQLQNMTPNGNENRLLLCSQESQVQIGQEPSRRYSSVYSADSFKNPPMSAPVSAQSRAFIRGGPLNTPMTAPIRALLFSIAATEPQFFPDGDHYPKKLAYEEPPKKRSRSLQTDSPVSHHSSLDNLTSEQGVPQPLRHPYFVQNYVPSPLQHPVVNGGFREFRPEMPMTSSFSETPVYDSSHHGPEMFRGFPSQSLFPVASQEQHESGYEPFLAPSVPPTLNNRAFGLQVSRQPPQMPYSFSSMPSYSHVPQQRWDAFPAVTPIGATAARLDAHTEDVEHDHEIYE